MPPMSHRVNCAVLLIYVLLVTLMATDQTYCNGTNKIIDELKQD